MVGIMMDDEIPPMVHNCINKVLKGSLRQMKADFTSMVTNALAIVVKKSPGAQAGDPEIWALLKVNFESSLDLPSDTCRLDDFSKRDHDDHSDDHPEGEKGSKKHKTTKGSSSANVTS
ncbi:hypothetical protein Tco_0456075 [Tanacetum coccineum]